MKIRRVIVATLASLAVVCLGGLPAGASTPQTITVQGFLSDKSGGGAPVPANGTFDITFTLFDDEFAGLSLASQLLQVDVADGVYEAELTFPAVHFTGGTDRWLELVVDTETLSPRIRVASTPYAYVADKLDGVDAFDLEESAEITSAVASHEGDPDAHVDHSALEESAEITSEVASHGADAGAHSPAIGAHAADADAHYDHSTLEESGEIGSHASDPNAHVDHNVLLASHQSNPTAHPYVLNLGDTMSGALTISPPPSAGYQGLVLKPGLPGDTAPRLSLEDAFGVSHRIEKGPGALRVYDEAGEASFSLLNTGDIVVGESSPGSGVYRDWKLTVGIPEALRPEIGWDNTEQWWYQTRGLALISEPFIYRNVHFPVFPGVGSLGPPAGAEFRIGVGFTDFPADNIPGGSGAGDTYRDNLFCVTYNAKCGGSGKIIANEHAFDMTLESDYWADAAGVHALEYNWNWQPSSGVGFRPFALFLSMGPDGDGPGQASFTFTTSDTPDRDALLIAGGNQVSVDHAPGWPVAAAFQAHKWEDDGPSQSAIRGYAPFTVDSAGGQELAAVRGEMKPTIALDGNVGSGLYSGYFEAVLQGSSFASTFGAAGGPVGIFGLSGVAGDGGGAAPAVTGMLAQLDFSGSNWSLGNSDGLYVKRAFAPGSGTTVARYDAIRINDQQHGSLYPGSVIRIEQQSGDGDRGNINMVGGAWNTGHLQLGGVHLFRSSVDNTPRYDIGGGPTADTSGQPIYAAFGMNSNWGDVYWGDGGTTGTDQGSEICGNARLTCQRTVSFDFSGNGLGSEDCSFTHADYFLAFCKK